MHYIKSINFKKVQMSLKSNQKWPMYYRLKKFPNVFEFLLLRLNNQLIAAIRKTIIGTQIYTKLFFIFYKNKCGNAISNFKKMQILK